MNAQQETHMTSKWPTLGSGVGLRTVHYPIILKEWPRMDWFEAITENYMDSGGRPIYVLEEVRKRYPVALHGVSLSIGSVDPLDPRYLERLKTLCNRIDPAIVSDHLCWSGVDGEELHDLLPLPFTEEAIQHIVSRVSQIQELLGRRILLENVSTYITYKHSVMPEWEFLSEVAKRSGCGILLDLNNVYVNAVNHQFDAYQYIRSIPKDLVGQFHLAGHTNMGNYLFDTHSAPIIDSVWNLYKEALKLFGPVSTLIEWDEAIPAYERLSEEATKARAIQHQICGNSQSSPNVLTGDLADADYRFHGNDKQSPSLAEIERLMKSEIHLAREHSKSDLLKHWLNQQGGEEGIERLSVYTAGYIARTHDGLYEAYETIRKIIGADAFYELSHAYISHYSSQNYNLSFVGRYLPEFLKKSPLAHQFPFLSDLAALEWFAVETFHAFDEKPFDPKQLESLPLDDWERAKFVFQPSVRLMESEWPILNLWQERKNEEKPATLPHSKAQEHILISRHGFQVHAELLDYVQYQLLKRLISGVGLGDALEELSENVPQEIPIAQWFSSWVASGLITHCRVSSIVKV